MPKFVVYESGELDPAAASVWRVVDAIPAGPDHFRSLAELGVERRSAHYLTLAGVSHYRTLAEVRRAAKRYRLGDKYAEVDLTKDRRMLFAVTNERTGHVEIWAPPLALMACVVNYAKEPS
ncbi:MAG TPA: hypothetical protein VFI37_08010 [Gaiellaceae bacterium]|nr:hypothetical protein [Gaiellaceae bacterium]